MKILIIKQSSLGDVLHSTVPLRLIKNQYPKAIITFLTDKNSFPILKNNPLIDEFILIDLFYAKKNFPSHPFKVLRHFFSILKKVRADYFDLAIDLQGLLRSLLFLYFSKSKIKIGKTHYFFTPHYRNKHLHAIEEMKRLIMKVGIASKEINMEYFHDLASLKEVKQLIKTTSKKKVILLAPFTQWPSKNWSLVQIKHFISLVHKKVTVVISGASKDLQATKTILNNIKNNQCINLVGKLTLEQFSALMQQSDLIISCDSFPAHLACALQKKLLVLFGPTLESRVGPIGQHYQIVKAKNCSSCYNRYCKKNCMDQIKATFISNLTLKKLK